MPLSLHTFKRLHQKIGRIIRLITFEEYSGASSLDGMCTLGKKDAFLVPPGKESQPSSHSRTSGRLAALAFDTS